MKTSTLAIHATPMRSDIITFHSAFTASFPSMQACADAAHSLAVSTGALVLVWANGGLYFECFGHGIRAEGGVPYVPYVSGWVR